MFRRQPVLFVVIAVLLSMVSLPSASVAKVQASEVVSSSATAGGHISETRLSDYFYRQYNTNKIRILINFSTPATYCWVWGQDSRGNTQYYEKWVYNKYLPAKELDVTWWFSLRASINVGCRDIHGRAHGAWVPRLNSNTSPWTTVVLDGGDRIRYYRYYRRSP